MGAYLVTGNPGSGKTAMVGESRPMTDGRRHIHPAALLRGGLDRGFTSRSRLPGAQ